MNKSKLTVFIPTILLSSLVLAAGTHDSGHDNINSPAMNMEGGMQMMHWASPKEEASRKNPIKMSKDSVASGLALYQSYCASCHGKNAEGDGVAGASLKPKPANFMAMSGNHPDGDFAYKIRNGRGPMPGWGNILSDSDVWNLVNFIQSLNKKNASGMEKGHGHADGKKDHS